MRIAAAILLAFATLPAAALDCSAPLPAPAAPSGAIAPGPGLQGAAATARDAVFDRPAGDLSVVAVLARIHEERCSTTSAADTYQKQTEFDNSPYRFNMRPGEKMSAAAFDAWMESRGIRIVKAKDDTAAKTTAPVVAE